MTLLFPEALILLLGVTLLLLRRSVPWRLALVLALMIIALSRPAAERQAVEKRMEGVAAVIALDLSYSMQAKDIVPSRFQAAKKTIAKLVAQTPQNRYALFGFTTNALILSPFTRDSQLLESALEAIEVKNILTRGTSLHNLLQTLAKRSFPVHTVVLFTDGGEEQDLDALLQIVRKAGIRIVAVGMGTNHGTLLKDRSGETLRDEKGRLVVARLNPLLAPLAEKSSGRYLSFEGSDTTAGRVAEALDEIALKERYSKREAGYRDYFWIPLLAALILFLFHFITLPKKWLLLLPFLGSSADAAFLDWYHIRQMEHAWQQGDFQTALHAIDRLSHPTLQSEFDKALVLYRQKKYKRAAAVLEPLRSRHRRMKYRILFLLGNSYARQGAYEKAARKWRQALALYPDDAALRHNLLLILGKKSDQQPKPPAFRKEKSHQQSFASKQKKRQQKKGDKEGKNVQKRAEKRQRRLGYKAYEMINKGYIDEKRPW